MAYQFVPVTLPLFLASLLAGAVTIYAWRQRHAHSALTLCLMSLAVTWWSLGSALEITALTLPAKMIWGKLQYLSITTIPGLWLIFVIQQTWRGRRTPRPLLAGLLVMPLLTIALAFTTEWHGLIWQREVTLIPVQDFQVMDITYGLGFQIYTWYTYAVLGTGMALVIHNLIRRQGLYRRQAVLVLVAALAPWVGNILYFTGFNPIAPLDLTPFAFTFSVLVMAWAIFGFQLMRLTPMARDLLVDEMQDGMLVLDAQDRIVDLNPAAQRLLEVRATDVLGMTASDLLQRWPPLLDRYRREPDSLTQITIGEGAEQRWYELRLSPLHDPLRRFIGQVVTIHDISEHKRVQEQLRQLSRAVEASPASIVITDPQGKIQYINPKFTQVTGYTEHEVLGLTSSILKTDQTPPEVHRQLWETIQQGKEWHGEFCNRKKNGDLFWEAASISPITDADGKITHYVAVKEDITDRKRYEEALSVARDQALEASQVKSQLLAKVNHELRTPLGGILGYAELLRTGAFGPLAEEQTQAMGQIVESVNYLTGIVNELLDAAQIEARKLTLQMEACNPQQLIQEVEANMQVLAGHKGLQLITHISPNVPMTVFGDPRRLKQVLINLVGNAIKYTETGQVQVTAFCPDASHWMIQVQDTGIGIPREAQAYVFEPFRQVDNLLTHNQRGTGLGLSITKQLVDLMGGEISLESTVGKGSIFMVKLPIRTRASTGTKPLSPLDVQEETL